MYDMGYLRFFADRKEVVVGISTIIYCLMSGSFAEIHMNSGKVYISLLMIINLRDYGESHSGILIL